MGLGKTVSTLTAIDELMHNRFDVKRCLVIAPLRVAEDTWSRECQKWDHLNYLKISKVLGMERERIHALNSKADIYVINRENVEWLVDLYGKHFPFDMVVIDELSSFKSPKSKRFRALRKVLSGVKRVVGLTGTPTPNGLLDLWSQMYLIDQGQRLGKSMTEYRDRYFTAARRNGYIVFSYDLKPSAERKIYESIGDVAISMSAQDWLAMPKRINNIVPVKMSDQALQTYKQLERDLLLPFADGDITVANAAVLSNKLLQLANGAIYSDDKKIVEIHNAKLDALGDLIEAANGKPMLVFYSYKHDAQRIAEQFVVRHLTDSKDIADWNSGQIPVLIAHPASTGHGLNLQDGGSTIVWFGATWSLELYEQANARLHRQGQKQSVIVHHLVAQKTLDVDVMDSLADKGNRQERLLQALKARIDNED
jgi:SNF2 family DNA or RNA helicase